MSTLQRRLMGGLAGLVALGAAALLPRPWFTRSVVPNVGPTAALPRFEASSLEKPDAYGRVPEFALIEQSGARVTLADFLGKVWVADFIYTRCPDTCPLQSAHMAHLQTDFSRERSLRLVSITVDPAHDTPAVLSAYGTRFGADPRRWLFLTGSKAVIFRLAREGFHLGAADSTDPSPGQTSGGLVQVRPRSHSAHLIPTRAVRRLLHSARFILVDRRGTIRGYYDGTDLEALSRLRQSLTVLLDER